MKRTLFLIALLAVIITGAKAQNLITVQHAGTPAFYTALPAAITATAAGDTVYVPGGTFDPITINKKIVMIGAGINPDSTKVTSRTIVTSITFSNGADNGSMTGIYTPSIVIKGGITGYTFSRNYIGNIYNTGTFSITNFVFTENIIGTMSLSYGKNNTLYNNIVTGSILLPANGYVRNNIFANSVYEVFDLQISNSIIENNIFSAEEQPYSSDNVYGTGNIFNNNINAGTNGMDGINNIFPANNLADIFPTFSPSALTTDAIFKVDFSMAATSPYKNSGTDGTDLGVYGGAYPWKIGSIPSNPHFQSLSVAPKTDTAGNLQIQLTVTAQDH